jgi:hypothetical protein
VAVADAGQQRAGGGRADAGHLHQAATTLTCSGRRAAAARQALCRRGARGRARRGLATLVSAFGAFHCRFRRFLQETGRCSAM